MVLENKDKKNKGKTETKPINMDEIQQNLREICTKGGLGSSVKYYLYNDPDDTIDIISEKDLLNKLEDKNDPNLTIRNKNSACFAQFTYSEDYNFRVYKNSFIKGRNRVAYIIPGIVTKNFKREDIIRWLKLCRKNKLLPAYIDPKKSASKGIVVIKLDQKNPKLSPSLLFVYLSVLRDMSEHYAKVLATLKLLDDYDLDFITAYIIAYRLVGYASHSFFTADYTYGQNRNSIALSYLVGLRRYLKDPNKYDKRKLEMGQRFDTSQKIVDAFKTKSEIKIEKLSNPELIKLTKSPKAKIADFNKFL